MTIATTNESWGFYGTISSHADPAQAWTLAMQAIMTATTNPDTAVRDFLDSPHGRHFADDVANELATEKPLPEAITAATARWMAWKISRQIARDTGIPSGLPYLTGFVTSFEIEADNAA